MARAHPKSASTPLAPGFVLGGRVRLVRPLAAGGMGEVWVAVNEATGAELAAKVWRPVGADVATRERFTHEAQLGAKLAHRSIVRIFDLIAEPDGTLVLLMELLRGETLEQRLASSGPMSEREAIATMVPVLSALQHAHDHGIVHRDVKPANILLSVDPDGTVTPKLLDFGIAKVPSAGNHTVGVQVLGTPSYMSPEHIRGRTDLDGRSDLFSAGAVLFELLCGRPPFRGATPSGTLAAVLEHDLDPEPGVSPRLWTEIARALAKRPYERHRSASEMATALCAAIGATESELATALPKVKPPIVGATLDYGTADLVSEVPSRVVERPSVVTRRRRAMWVVLGVCGLAAGVVAFAAVGRRREESARPAASASAAMATTASASVVAPAVSAQPDLPAAPLASAPVTPSVASPPPVRPLPFPMRPRGGPSATATAAPATPPPPRAVATTPGF